MSKADDVQHIINFLRDNEIETGHNKGVKPLEDMLNENKKLNLENQKVYEDSLILAMENSKLEEELKYYKDKEQAEIDDFENRDRWE